MEKEHLFGNFHRYYEFNPVEERLKWLAEEVCQGLRRVACDRARRWKMDADGGASEGVDFYFCDIGCNEGDVTIGLERALSGAAAVTSADTWCDPQILCRLNDVLQKTARRAHTTMDRLENGMFTCAIYIDLVFHGQGIGVSKKAARIRAAHMTLDRLDGKGGSEQRPDISDTCRGKRLVAHGLGVDLDPCLISRAQEKSASMPYLDFACLNIMEDGATRTLADWLPSECQGTFDLIACLSITMWIHIHHGDDGLLSFLKSIAQHTTHLLIETQPWKCYRNACRRMKRLGIPIPSPFTNLKMQQNVQTDIETFLMSDTCGFKYQRALGQTSWTRRLVLFSKTPLEY